MLWITTACEAALVGAAFLPWVQTGQARRSSFRLLRDLNTLGVLRGQAATSARVIWVLLPALAALGVLLAALGARRSALATAVAVGLIGLGGAVATSMAPVTGLIGARLALALGPITVLSGLVTLVNGARQGRDARRAVVRPAT